MAGGSGQGMAPMVLSGDDGEQAKRSAAVRVVAASALDAADLVFLLDVLGLDAAEGRRR